MGLHMLPEKVSNLHKWMISQGNVLGKPIVLASQIVNLLAHLLQFDSMLVGTEPLREECSDITHSILEGADAIILGNETSFRPNSYEVVERLR